MKLLDPFDPIFEKAWVRYLTTFPALVWGGVEVWSGSPGWGIIFLALGAYAYWQLFIVRPKGK
jgi:hypothetical protein